MDAKEMVGQLRVAAQAHRGGSHPGWTSSISAGADALELLPELVELLGEAKDNAKASTVEDGISQMRREYREELCGRLSAALAKASKLTKEVA